MKKADFRLTTGSLRRLAVIGLAAVAVPVLAVAPREAPFSLLDGNVPQAAPGGDQASATALAVAIRKELAELPAQASVEDIEASIVFAVSQANASNGILALAFNDLRDAAPGLRNLQDAVFKVRVAMLDKKLRRGTAAVVGNGQVGFGLSTFSSPVVTVGGGTTNYSR